MKKYMGFKLHTDHQRCLDDKQVITDRRNKLTSEKLLLPYHHACVQFPKLLQGASNPSFSSQQLPAYSGFSQTPIQTALVWILNVLRGPYLQMALTGDGSAFRDGSRERSLGHQGTPSSRIHPQRRCWDSGLSFCFLVKRWAISLSHSLPPWCYVTTSSKQWGNALDWTSALPSWRCVPSSSAGLLLSPHNLLNFL